MIATLAKRGVSVYAIEVFDCWYKYNGMVITGTIALLLITDTISTKLFSQQNAFIILETYLLYFHVKNANQEYDMSKLETWVKKTIMLYFCK